MSKTLLTSCLLALSVTVLRADDDPLNDKAARIAQEQNVRFSGAQDMNSSELPLLVDGKEANISGEVLNKALEHKTEEAEGKAVPSLKNSDTESRKNAAWSDVFDYICLGLLFVIPSVLGAWAGASLFHAWWGGALGGLLGLAWSLAVLSDGKFFG